MILKVRVKEKVGINIIMDTNQYKKVTLNPGEYRLELIDALYNPNKEPNRSWFVLVDEPTWGAPAEYMKHYIDVIELER